jgi:hypothetical protein
MERNSGAHTVEAGVLARLAAMDRGLDRLTGDKECSLKDRRIGFENSKAECHRDNGVRIVQEIFS